MKLIRAGMFNPEKRFDDAAVERGYRLFVEREEKRGDVAALKALEMERRGGPCHYCGVPFAEVKVNNRYAEFSYFEPACHCYKRCQEIVTEACLDDDKNPVPAVRCGRWMVEERFKELSLCIACHGEPRKEEKREPKKRKKSFKDAKAAAAGENEEN